MDHVRGVQIFSLSTYCCKISLTFVQIVAGGGGIPDQLLQSCPNLLRTLPIALGWGGRHHILPHCFVKCRSPIISGPTPIAFPWGRGGMGWVGGYNCTRFAILYEFEPKFQLLRLASSLFCIFRWVLSDDGSTYVETYTTSLWFVKLYTVTRLWGWNFVYLNHSEHRTLHLHRMTSPRFLLVVHDH